MSAQGDRFFLLICGKEKHDRKAFWERLSVSIRRKWRICSPDFVEPMHGRAEIEFLGELSDIDATTGDPVVSQPRVPEAGIVIAALPFATVADDNAKVESERLRIIDLNRMPFKDAHRTALRLIQRMDADKIGTFAGIGGLVEVGLGSILHAYKVPLKGHFLSSLQNLLLVSFGKALHGRGLIRISFVSAMLKAFSPMGGAVRPMLFIFLQGAVFAFPIHVFGWNALAALSGSVLMGAVTLGISFAMNFLMFGSSIFDAVEKGVGQVLSLIDVETPTLAHLLIFAFSLRAAVSGIVFAVAYFGNPLPYVSRVTQARFQQKQPNSSMSDTSASLGRRASAAGAALRGIVRPKFLVAFLVSVLMMRFFTDLSSAELMTIAVRGLCISYLGFLLMQRIDVQALGARLDRRFGLDLERSLPIAARLIGRPRRG